MDNSIETRIFEFGEFHLDAARRQLSGPDGVIEVPSRAFDVLLYMVAHRGELLDKPRLLKAVWPKTVVEEGNLSQCIFALRRALGDTASEPRFIATNLDAAINSWRRCASRLRWLRRLKLRGPVPGSGSTRAPAWR